MNYTLDSLKKVPAFYEKTKISILPYALFLVVLLERIQDFWLQYFTYSYGNMQYILEN